MLQRAAFFDIDGTLTSERTWKGMMAYFRQHRLRRKTHLAFWAVNFPRYLLRKARLISESAFREPWAAHLAWYVRGYTLEEAQPVWDWIVTQFMSRYWRSDIRTVLDEHRQAGDVVMLVSAAPLPLVERIAAEVGAQHSVGTRFEVANGRYTGRACPPVVIDAGKTSATRAALVALGLTVDLPASSSYADSISDLAILEMVGNPAAVYPDEALRAVATQRGWRIIPS